MEQQPRRVDFARRWTFPSLPQVSSPSLSLINQPSPPYHKTLTLSVVTSLPSIRLSACSLFSASAATFTSTLAAQVTEYSVFSYQLVLLILTLIALNSMLLSDGQSTPNCVQETLLDEAAMSLHQPRSRLQPNQLCQSCIDNLFPDNDWERTWKGYCTGDLKDGTEHHPKKCMRGPFSTDAARKASEAGCHFCSLVLEAICERIFLYGAKDPCRTQGQGHESCCSLYDVYVIHIRHKYQELEVLARKREDGDLVFACRLMYRPLTATDRDESREYHHPDYGKLVQRISHTNLGEPIVEQVKEWIQICRENHPKCNASYEYKRQRVPVVRLIDLGISSHQSPKLVDSHLAGADRPTYITLSYRWTSEAVKHRLTRTNKDIYYQALPATEWPQTYKDTASLARQLGVRYVWIDSLCIIQDDPMDWAEQASTMDMIYENGLLNVAAILGEQTPGLECSRNPLGIIPCVVSSTVSPADSTGEHKMGHYMFSRRINPFQTTLGYRQYEYNNNPAPLYERGWTLQERLLSRRTIHVGKQVLWECMSSWAWDTFPLLNDDNNRIRDETQDIEETFPELGEFINWAMSNSTYLPNNLHKGDNRNPDEIHHYKRFLAHEFGDLKSTQSESDHQWAFYTMWKSLVCGFSHMSLTEPKDKLVAIRGIMNRLQDKVPHPDTSSYAGGLWDTGDSFGLYLHWQTTLSQPKVWLSPETRQLAGVLVQHFPSWSWAAGWCGVQLDTISEKSEFDSHQELIKLESIRGSDDNGTDPLGPARIVLRGKLVPLINQAELLTEGQTQSGFCFQAKCLLPAHINKYTGKMCGICADGFLTFPMINLDRPIMAQDPHGELALLPLYASSNKLSNKLRGLVLERIGTLHESPVYKRVGDFRDYVSEDCLCNFMHISPSRSKGRRLVQRIPEELYYELMESTPIHLV